MTVMTKKGKITQKAFMQEKKKNKKDVSKKSVFTLGIQWKHVS